MTTSGRNPDSFRIWIHSNYYLQVDRFGYILGTCYEGALGCVVPLLSAVDHNRLALKVPRMLADTVRENAFISQVVSAESVIVHRANEEFKATAGLIPVQELGRNILRGVRELRNASTQEARQQDGCILLFYFRKDRNPRVCALRYDGEQRLVFPPDSERDLSFFTRELWDRARESACNFEVPEVASYYFEVGPQTPAALRVEGIVHSPLIGTMTTSDGPQVWFAALPSILYNWANGTLQEAVSQARLQVWSLDQHYELCCRVLRGVDTLHSKRFIHGDLRPANIMTCGPGNAPENYVVGDYGSFSEDFSRLGGPQNAGSGHTVVGGLGRHRTSVFYAPERRAGVERESADVALILSTLDDVIVTNEYLIYFGWRSCLIDPRTHAPDEQLLQTLRNDWRRMREAAEGERHALVGDRLAPGDRLRVREFIFTVLDAEEVVDEAPLAETEAEGANTSTRRVLSRRMVVRCSSRFAQVVHERLTVYDECPRLQDCMVVGLPNYVELRQWSVATDVYGVGALILYTMFMSGLQRGIPVADELLRARDDTMGNAETLLQQMLEILEGLPSFLALWSDLEDFRWNLEHQDNASLSGVDLARVEIRSRPNTYPDAGEGHGVSFPSEDPNERRTLGGFALRTVNNLLRSVPNIRYVLHKFQCVELMRGGIERSTSTYNAAHFLLFVHFVMACLHRRSHLRAVGETELIYPFCRDRCDSPVPNGPAAKTLARLTELKLRLLQPRYDGIVVEDKQLVNFDPRDVMQIRIEHAQLGRELAVRRREVADLKQMMDEAAANVARAQETLAGEAQRSAEALSELRKERQAELREIESLRKELLEMKAVRGRIETEFESSKAQAQSLRERTERIHKELVQARELVLSRENAIELLGEEVATHRTDVGRLTEELRQKKLELQLQAQRVQVLENSLATTVQEREAVMVGMTNSMRQALLDLEEIRRGAWRVPEDSLRRLQKLLATWQSWGRAEA